MTENISDYSFDFEQEVNRLKQEHKTAAQKTMFTAVNIIAPPRNFLSRFFPGKVKISLPHIILGDRLKQYDVVETCEGIIDNYAQNPDDSSYKSRIDPENNSAGSIVAFNNNDPRHEVYGPDQKSLLRLFGFYHEFAHVLIANGPPVDKNHPFLEIAADAYAALRLLQRFGPEAVPFLSLKSWYRSFEMIASGSTSHFSSHVLDRIIAHSATHDFTGLRPAQLVRLSRKYAKEGTPSPEALKKARFVLKKTRGYAQSASKAHLILETSLRTSSQLAFYIGAKYFQPFLHPAGVEFNGRKFSYKPETQQRYRELIENRADVTQSPRVAELLGIKQHHLALFNKTAAKSLNDFLPVSLPAGQERFAFRFR